MKEFLMGNVAAAKAAMENGLEFFAGYPITPSTEFLEVLAANMDHKSFMNSFSEVETINLLYGAGAAGIRTCTATSGCGLSLMREGLSYAVGAKVPMVIYNAMRFGPGLGGITTSNQDVNICWGVGHGQSKVPVLTPSTVQEIADCMMAAFDIADTLRMPVIVMVDATLAQLYEEVEIHKSEFQIPPKEWAVGKHKNNVITSRKIIQSYKMNEDEQNTHIKFIMDREANMIHVCKLFMKETVKIKEHPSGNYIAGIGITGRVIQEVAEQMDMGYIVPLLLNPLDLNIEMKSLTTVEVGGTGLFDIMKGTKSLVFNHSIPSVEEVIKKL